MTSEPERLGVVGLGAMGSRLAGALAASGADVVGVDPVVALDAVPPDVRVSRDLADLADRDVVVLSLPGRTPVLDVVADLGARWESTGDRWRTVLDTSTIGPDDARDAARLAATLSVTYADCPVLGRPASVGSWTIPVGGSAATVALAQRVLAPAAARVEGVGEVGTASATKVLNNLMLGTINAVTAELLVLAQAAGLDPGRWVDLVVDSGAASVSPLFRDVAARAVDGDFAPTFTVALMHKDNALALALADAHDVPVLAGRAAQQLNTMALAAGLGAQDSIAVVQVLESLTGRSARRQRPRTT